MLGHIHAADDGRHLGSKHVWEIYGVSVSFGDRSEISPGYCLKGPKVRHQRHVDNPSHIRHGPTGKSFRNMWNIKGLKPNRCGTPSRSSGFTRNYEVLSSGSSSGKVLLMALPLGQKPQSYSRCTCLHGILCLGLFSIRRRSGDDPGTSLLIIATHVFPLAGVVKSLPS